MLGALRKDLRRRFITGLLVITPLAITIFFIKFLFTIMDGILGPLISRVLGIHVPGLGVLATLVLIFLAGIATTNFLGRKVVEVGETILERVPLVKTIYSGSKQLVEALFVKGKDSSMRRLVMVEWPRKGSYSIGFMTNIISLDVGGGERKELVSVFIPTVPNPTTGFVFLLPKEDIIPLPFSMESGVKLIMSGGLAVPSELVKKSPGGTL